jgi:hypothetical protein
MKGDTPFDMEGERKRPTWGDPTFRKLAADATGESVEVNHLHIDTSFIKEDINVALPLDRLRELVAEGFVGSVAETHYSTMGYQGADTSVLENETAPQIAASMRPSTSMWRCSPLSDPTVAGRSDWSHARSKKRESPPSRSTCSGPTSSSSACRASPPSSIRSPAPSAASATRKPSARCCAPRWKCSKRRRTPGHIEHLPFVWPEPPEETKWHPPEPSPIIALLKSRSKK